MTAETALKSKISTGSPAQHAQPSRKGKKAWRKNVDIGEVESALEDLRAQERVIGSAVHSKTDEQLFQIDATGDENVRKVLPKFKASELSYNKLLAQRSAVPAVYSKPSTKRPSAVSYEEKSRLLRIGKRKRLGPLNSIIDPTELGSGSATMDPSHAVKQSGKRDIWDEKDEDADVSEEKKDFLLPLVKRPKIKPPKTPNPRSEIEIPAVPEPHQGTSYNPTIQSHQELLRLANEKAEQAEKAAEKYAGVKETMDAARKAQEYVLGVPLGMTVDDRNEEEEEEATEEVESAPPKQPTKRKTKQQRQKALRLREEKRTLAEKLARKRFLASISASRSMRSSIEKARLAREQAREQRRQALREKIRQSGLAGERLGKHHIPEGQVDVQLGEDLSESLRGLKVEGNLFRDRFLSLQHRALVEPRVPVIPKRRRPVTKEVEKFAWKRFE